MTDPIEIRIASRESRLAMAQSEWMAAQLGQRYPGVRTPIIGMTTQGDQILDKPLNAIGGKGLFIKELEVALEEGRADIAVHSMKDVPMTLPDGFSAVIVGLREETADAFVSNHHASLDALPRGANVGTSSLRRECQLRIVRPDLNVTSLRGNVNTRLRKLDEGQYDAIILAAAGLRRLGMNDRIRAVLDRERFLPAIAQGALGIEFRADRADLAAWLAPFTTAQTSAAVAAERAFGRALGASCDVPLGAHATVDAAGWLQIEGFIALPDGSRHLRQAAAGASSAAEAIGLALAERLMALGGRDILAQLHRAQAAPRK